MNELIAKVFFLAKANFFIFEGKTDLLIIGMSFLLTAVFLLTFVLLD